MPYGVRFTDIGHTGHSDWATLVRQKYRHGDEDDRASEREPLAPAPALIERRYRSLACRFSSVEQASAGVGRPAGGV
jgi:hypothetical protein